jgi:hypothetical protein
MDYSNLKSRTWWTATLLTVYNLLISVVPVIPNVPWLTVVIDILGVILVGYFHVKGIQNAVQASLSAGKPSSGQ